jgi:hypothetical protein
MHEEIYQLSNTTFKCLHTNTNLKHEKNELKSIITPGKRDWGVKGRHLLTMVEKLNSVKDAEQVTREQKSHNCISLHGGSKVRKKLINVSESGHIPNFQPSKQKFQVLSSRYFKIIMSHQHYYDFWHDDDGFVLKDCNSWNKMRVSFFLFTDVQLWNDVGIQLRNLSKSSKFFGTWSSVVLSDIGLMWARYQSAKVVYLKFYELFNKS